MKPKSLIITIFSLFFGCSNLHEDKTLILKTIESENYKIEWYTKSGLTTVYPNYIDITNKIEHKKHEIVDHLDILDIILIDNDSLFIIYNKNAQLSEIRKNDKKLGLEIIPKNYHIYYTGKRHY
ncbi:hypothetical protein IF128_02575 [Empedobacter stercoris]|uniref:hypothetical protein n=1 Tax=Empedobacter stercoris TaxID=1628248 RepID=UPI001662579F|nr:hypothetical protein [Empedobacter stercoris]MCA4776224.1 hypothetical protein [Empedobacter stercoris]MCA4808634.1 hypothetical protein [Empedobacter stercoris]QNT13647.1 hypothetical protein HNV03_02645 [Empedobacter stercoris]